MKLKELKDKILEALYSALPITALVYIMALTPWFDFSAVELITYMTPNKGTSHSNEVIIAFSGDASAVKTAVLTAREIGLALITAMGEYPGGPSTPYLS